jgi:hypothetical protein
MKSDHERPDDFRDLVDLYCSGLIEDEAFRRLEARLLDDEAARRYFASYFHHHTEIQFAIRAGHATDAVLDQLSSVGVVPARPAGTRRPGWLRSRYRFVAAAAALVVATLGAALWLGLPAAGQRRAFSAAASKSAPANIAWLVNAQDCLWGGKDQKPGRDMRAGKTLRLDRGLAEIEFEKGARVILQGPAGLELLSESSARLLYGTLTARVPAPARGFTVLSPGGKVVDLGTEFGLAVDQGGATTMLRVFTGEVEAFAVAAGQDRDHGVTIHQDEAALLDGRTVARESAERELDRITYVRAIVPPPVLTPRLLRLDFSEPKSGTLRDAGGRGIGLTHRLPGTGAALPGDDPNLRLDVDRRALELTTTRSDLNTQERMTTGEYLGVRLADLGFTGLEDFEIRATITDIPSLKQVGQFGLYAGSRSDTNIRGGLICRVGQVDGSTPDIFRAFLVNNSNGIDHDINEVGLIKTGDDLRLTLRRVASRYSLVVDHLRDNSSSTLEIPHPSFLDPEKELYVGLFGANTQSDLRKTLSIRELTVTVWTTQLEKSTMIGSLRRPIEH